MLSNGRVVGWGANPSGNVGVGSIGMDVLSPMFVNLPYDHNFVSVFAGQGLACFVSDQATNASVFCSRNNGVEQLGSPSFPAPFTYALVFP